jgi:hypothetical protein
MKTLNDIKQDMSDLYDAVKAGTVDLKTAGELANISGKFLKAEQLELATAVFLNAPLPRMIEQAPQITDASHEH